MGFGEGVVLRRPVQSNFNYLRQLAILEKNGLKLRSDGSVA